MNNKSDRFIESGEEGGEFFSRVLKRKPSKEKIIEFCREIRDETKKKKPKKRGKNE